MFKDYVNEEYGHTLVEVDGDLPTDCQDITICDYHDCEMFPSISSVYGTFYVKRTDPNPSNLQLPLPCTVASWRRVERMAIQDPTEADTTDTENPGKGFLNFNLPGFRYCGPGTDIEKMDDLGGPMNELGIR